MSYRDSDWPQAQLSPSMHITRGMAPRRGMSENCRGWSGCHNQPPGWTRTQDETSSMERPRQGAAYLCSCCFPPLGARHMIRAAGPAVTEEAFLQLVWGRERGSAWLKTAHAYIVASPSSMSSPASIPIVALLSPEFYIQHRSSRCCRR